MSFMFAYTESNNVLVIKNLKDNKVELMSRAAALQKSGL